jgi:hypothetical protein
MHQLHSPTAKVFGRTHAELFLEANAQGPRRDSQQRADLRTPEIPLRLSFQQGLEADREILVLTCGGHNLDRRPFREGLDQGSDQLLLQPVCRFAADERVRTTFDRADGSRMQVAQMPSYCRPQE